MIVHFTAGGQASGLSARSVSRDVRLFPESFPLARPQNHNIPQTCQVLFLIESLVGGR